MRICSCIIRASLPAAFEPRDLPPGCGLGPHLPAQASCRKGRNWFTKGRSRCHQGRGGLAREAHRLMTRRPGRERCCLEVEDGEWTALRRLEDVSASKVSADLPAEATAEPVQGSFFSGYGGHSAPEAPGSPELQTQQQLQTKLCHELSELVKVQQAWYSMLSSACRHQQEQPRPEEPLPSDLRRRQL
ncbi:hypothetical protein AK812_SmicGene13797 [Symbiodinium microadriaticum]|uniref:Uncharacterized protein n=1 Tax=Symbiodinium microadriaticum TaxID=2951 RepID=A0A1Q9E768_SYMMI|nr:hypothetical protein AK812_SmicGene13797 [Symbiodinium microadriaticum]